MHVRLSLIDQKLLDQNQEEVVMLKLGRQILRKDHGQQQRIVWHNNFKLVQLKVAMDFSVDFLTRPTPDPYNPGCAGGPRSITVLSQSKSSEQDSVREIIAHDGVKGKLTDKSTNHLTSKHGDVLGIDDPLPPNPNQKPTKYEKIRTRINKENKEKFGDTVEEILKDPNTEPYPDVSMRGIKGHGYYTENYGESGFFVGIHTEGEFKGQIKKAQPISEQQLKILQEENRID
jgi:hypothetical protein